MVRLFCLKLCSPTLGELFQKKNAVVVAFVTKAKVLVWKEAVLINVATMKCKKCNQKKNGHNIPPPFFFKAFNDISISL